MFKFFKVWVTGLFQKSKPVVILCPWCGHRITTRFLVRPLVTVLKCKGCRRQVLVGGTLRHPYAINPAQLTEKGHRALCSYGCHFAEPYGFVPMAGCPIHD